MRSPLPEAVRGRVELVARAGAGGRFVFMINRDDQDVEVDVLGPADLMKAIAASPAAQRCYAQKWVEHAFERTINAYDACTVDMMAQKLTAGGYTIKALIADLTQSQTFRYRAVEVTP